ncbi:MAG: hypothetical protein ACFFCO_08015 [Promethearchaeota archaeon]
MVPGTPAPVMLLREYLLPSPAVSTHVIKRLLVDIDNSSYSSGYIWSTDYALDKLYRLTPATSLTQTMSMFREYQLPNYFGPRNPLCLYVDDVNLTIWFTDPASGQVSALNYVTNVLLDWNVSAWGIPGDIERVSNTEVVFTFLNSTRFGILNPFTMGLAIYTIFPVGGPAPGVGSLAKIAHNTTHYYMTDSMNDVLYEFQCGIPPILSGVRVYPLMAGGQSHDVNLDPSQNVWVTQPGLDNVCEQLTGSQYKDFWDASLEFDDYITYNVNYLEPVDYDIPIRLTPIRATVFNTTPTILGDPLHVYAVPTAPSLPIGIAADNGGYAWFTCPGDNKMCAIDPLPMGFTYEYLLPTPNCLPLYTTISDNDHVWFTEYAVQTWGELFYGDFVDIRVSPSRPKHYPPPTPGSIRWTWEPGAEIWVDAPSNGYNPSDHDSPERPGVNHVYARVKNLGTTTANNINVSFYYHNMSLGFAQWIPLSTDPNPTAWFYIDSYIIASLAPGAQVDIYVDWSIPSTAPIHQCIGVQAKCATDINLYDNVCYRNLNIVTALAGAPATITRKVWITNNQPAGGIVRVAVGPPPPGDRTLPPGWQVSITPNNFYLGSGESKELEIQINIPDSTKPTERVSIHLSSTIDNLVIGHLWFEIRLVGSSSITCAVTPTTVNLNEVVYFSGLISPAVVNETVYIHITKPDGVTYEIGTTTNSSGGFSASTGLNNINGTYSFYTYWNGNSKYMGATSSTCRYTVQEPSQPVIPPISLDLIIGFVFGFGLMAVIALILFLIRRRKS